MVTRGTSNLKCFDESIPEAAIAQPSCFKVFLVSTKSAYQNPLEEYSRGVGNRVRAEVLEGKLLTHDLRSLNLGRQTMLFSAGMGIDTICGTCGKSGAFFRCSHCGDLVHGGPRCCTQGAVGEPHKCIACGSKVGQGPIPGQYQDSGIAFGDISIDHLNASQRPYLMIDVGSQQRAVKEQRFAASAQKRVQIEALAHELWQAKA